MQNNNVKQQIDSHSSYLTNRELHTLLMEADILSIQASNSIQYGAVNSFYNTVEAIYVICSGIMDEEKVKDINKYRKRFKIINDLVISNPKFRTYKAIKMMLVLTKEIYIKIRIILQKMNYFFRTSAGKQKGLSDIGYFIENNIFTKKKIEEQDDTQEH